MKENPAVKELEMTLRDVINAHIDNEGISYAELMGVLEILKFRFQLQLIEDEDED